MQTIGCLPGRKAYALPIEVCIETAALRVKDGVGVGVGHNCETLIHNGD